MHAEAAVELSRAIGSPVWIAIAAGFLASIAVGQRDLDRAAAILGEAVDEPPRTMGQRLLAYAFPMETTYTWHDTPTGGTRMTLRNRGEPSGFANLAAALMSAQMRRSTTRDLKLLKSLMETRQSA
jgi:hypothetical protein